MGLGPAKLTDLDDPLRGPQAAATPATRKRVPRGERETQRGEEGGGRGEATTPPTPPAVEPVASRPSDEPVADPYAGSPKIAVNMRATKALWDRLGALTRELEAQEFRTSRTELTEALWHFHAPSDATAARDLIRRYRHTRIG